MRKAKTVKKAENQSSLYLQVVRYLCDHSLHTYMPKRTEREMPSGKHLTQHFLPVFIVVPETT